ncbi:MAG: hypothetical protein ACP5NV_04605 [Candidatus Woesearchaeota archaeon]
MGLEETTRKLFKFFNITLEEDIRYFSITNFNRAYLKKIKEAPDDSSKEEITTKYEALYNRIIILLREPSKHKHDDYNMISIFDEHCDLLRYNN